MAPDCFQIMFDCLPLQLKIFKNQIGIKTTVTIAITVIKMITIVIQTIKMITIVILTIKMITIVIQMIKMISRKARSKKVPKA